MVTSVPLDYQITKKYIRINNQYTIYDMKVNGDTVNLQWTTKSDGKVQFIPKYLIDFFSKSIYKIPYNLKKILENKNN